MCLFSTVQCKMSKLPLSVWTQTGLFCCHLSDPVKVCKVIHMSCSHGSWTKFEQNNSPVLPAGQSYTPFLSVSEHRNLRRWGLWILADHGFVFDSYVWFAQTSLDILVYKSQKDALSQSLFNLTTALHVSGVATLTHLQEHKTTVTTASGNRYTVLLSAYFIIYTGIIY